MRAREHHTRSPRMESRADRARKYGVHGAGTLCPRGASLQIVAHANLAGVHSSLRPPAARPPSVNPAKLPQPLEILDDRSLEVELIAPSRWLAWLKPGYGFAVHIEETDKTYPAVITRVGGRVDPVSQTIKVFGEIQGDANDLMAGTSGRVNIPPPK
jgi:hypothetical protein